MGGDPARASSSAIADSRRENAAETTGRYPMTSATKPSPMPDSKTVRKRPAGECGVTSPRPSVKRVVPLM